MDNIFIQFAIILSISSFFGLIAQKLKIPLVVSYLLTGLTISVLSIFDTSGSLVLHVLPEIGIAFVLFLIGMELDLSEIKSLGIPIIVSAIGQIIISTLLGFYLSQIFGFNTKEGMFLGIGLAFSSTIVVIKMLIENQDLNSLYGKLSIGILLIEDLIAVIALMMISVGSSVVDAGFQQNLPILTLIVKGLGLFVLTFVLSKYVLRRLFDIVAKSTELLFFTSITWCFVFTSLAVLTGFSVEIGAFLAGISLASSPYHLQIQGKIKPLRDFFMTLFFIYLGSQVKLNYILPALPLILVFTTFALIAKPVIYMAILGLFGFKKHTLFQTSINLSQISEFSLIVLVVGASSGGVSSLTISVMAGVALLSIIGSSILISHSRKIYHFVNPFLKIFERRKNIHFLESSNVSELSDHIIIIGAHRVGGKVVDYLNRSKIPFLVMDFNPHLVRSLREKGINVIYGDIGDPDVLDSLQIEKAKLIISTAPSLQDNQLLLSEVRRRNKEVVVVVRTDDENRRLELKELGANYVISPERVSGVYLVHQLKNHWPKASFAGLN